MKAIVLTNAGGTENLEVKNIDEPTIKDNELLIQVKAFSINPVDIKTRKGLAFYNALRENENLILGWDVSGIVIKAGKDVTQFKEGDEVFGMVNFPGHGQAYAEYVAAPADHVALKPNNLSHQQAAASTLALLTAWQVLTQQAKLEKGQRLLVQAAAGGVGHFAVQVGKHLGAYVIGTGSGNSESFVKDLGADEFVNYKEKNIETDVKDIDVVFDAIGGENPLRALNTVKKGGSLVAIAGGATDEVKKLAEEKGVKAWSYLVQSSGSDMKELAALLENETIKPHIYKEFALEEISKAHQQIETGHTKGKLVVTL